MSFLKKHKYLILLLIIFFLGFIIRFKLSQDPYLHNWDEKFHALVAKNLMEHPLKPTLYNDALLPYNYKTWYSNHIWLHKQPLPLWMISFSYKLFGVSEFVTRLPSLLLSSLAILITYLLGSLLFDRRIALLSAFFVSINGLLIELSSGRIATDHYDVLFMAFIEIAVLFAYLNASRKKIVFAILSGAFIGFALLTKWLPCLIVIPIHFFLLLHFGSRLKRASFFLMLSLFTCLLVGLPWQLFIVKNYPLESSWEYHYNWLHFSTELEGQGDSIFYYLEQIRINYSEIIYLPLLFFAYKLYITKLKDTKLLALLAWILLPLFFFSLAKTKMQGYILFIAPALFFITADFFFYILNDLKIQRHKLRKFLNHLIMAAILILPIRYCYERTKFGFAKPICESYHSDYKSLKAQIAERSVVLNVPQPVEFMFYNSCIAYSNTELNADALRLITSKGYKVFVYDQQSKKLHPLE